MLGMKVILDILMHGVIDADIIHRAADRVRNGPYFERLNEGTEVQHDPEYEAYDGGYYLVAGAATSLTSRSTGPAGSPASTHWWRSTPSWFVRRSDGEIIGVYTKAFDGANLAWQDYFMESADACPRLLDGFRFDAPTYNALPNWSPETESRASSSTARLRRALCAAPTALKGSSPTRCSTPSQRHALPELCIWTSPTTTTSTG